MNPVQTQRIPNKHPSKSLSTARFPHVNLIQFWPWESQLKKQSSFSHPQICHLLHFKTHLSLSPVSSQASSPKYHPVVLVQEASSGHILLTQHYRFWRSVSYTFRASHTHKAKTQSKTKVYTYERIDIGLSIFLSIMLLKRGQIWLHHKREWKNSLHH